MTAIFLVLSIEGKNRFDVNCGKMKGRIDLDMLSRSSNLMLFLLVGLDQRSFVCCLHGPVTVYCRLGNFRVTFISRFFYFRIIHDFLNLRATG